MDAKQQVTVERLEKFKNRKPRNELPHVGNIAPRFTLPNSKNEPVSLEHSKLTVVVFWTSWSSHCQKELEKLEELYKQYGQNVQFYLINHTAYDTEEEARKLLANKSIEAVALFDRNGQVADDYSIEVYPTGFIIGTDGKVKERWSGNVSDADWKAKITNPQKR